MEVTDEELQQMSRRLDVLNRFAQFVNTHNEFLSQQSGYDPREERQLSIYEDIYRFMEQGKDLGYIHAATGIGKTVVMARVINATRMKTIIVVPKVDLISGTITRLAEFAPQIPVGIVDAKHKDFDQLVTVTTHPSFLIHSNRGIFDLEGKELIFVDEVDFGATQKRQRAISLYPQATKLGFTGTDYSLGDEMGEKVHDFGIPEGIREGLLAPVKVLLVNTQVDLEKSVRSDGTIDPGIAEKGIRAANIEHTPAEVYKNLFYRGEGDFDPSICYVSRNAQADRVAVHFLELGILAKAVHTGKSHEENEAAYRELRAGLLPVIVGVGKPIRGVDFPTLVSILNFTPSASPTSVGQKVGRVTRLDPQNPDKIGVVVDWVYDLKNVRQVLATDILGSSINAAELRDREGELTGINRSQTQVLGQNIGLEVIIGISEIARFLQTKAEVPMSISRTVAPDDWARLSMTDPNFEVITQIARKFLDQLDPEDIPRYYRVVSLGEDKDLARYFSPSLVEYIEKQVYRDVPIPRGFRNDNDIAKNIFGTKTTTPKFKKLIQQAVDDIRQEHKEKGIQREISGRYFVFFHNKLITFHSPEVIKRLKAIVKEINKNTGNPNLVDIYELAGYFNRKSESVIAEIKRRIQSGKLPNFRVYQGFGKGGQLVDLYDKEQILSQMKDYTSNSTLMPGSEWVSVNEGLKAEYGITPKTMKGFVNRFNLRETAPEWFMIGQSPRGKPNVPYIHESLISCYLTTVEMMRAPDLALTVRGIALQQGVAAETIKKVIIGLRQEDSVFEPILATNDRNQFFDFYLPNQVEVIVSRLAERKK